MQQCTFISQKFKDNSLLLLKIIIPFLTFVMPNDTSNMFEFAAHLFPSKLVIFLAETCPTHALLINNSEFSLRLMTLDELITY